MGIQYLHDDGYPADKRRSYPEDGSIFCPRGNGLGIFGVLDGVSFWTPSKGPPLFDGLTQGQLATRVVATAFFRADPRDELSKILAVANLDVLEKALHYGLSLEQPEHLPGADIAAVRIDGEKVVVVNTSDCGIMLVMRNGSVWVSPNQALAYETIVEKTFASIKAKYAGDPDQLNKAWDEWLPIRAKMVREYGNKRVPNGWAMINGEHGFVGLWQESVFPRDEVVLAICYTDGFTTVEDTADRNAMAKRWAALYASGGLPEILKESRTKQRAKLPQSHEAVCPEATAIAIPVTP